MYSGFEGSRHYAAYSPTGKQSAKVGRYFGPNRNQEDTYSSHYWNRPNANTHQDRQRESPRNFGRKYHQQSKFSYNPPESRYQKFSSGSRRDPANYEPEEDHYRSNGMRLGSKYRANSNERSPERQETEVNMVLKNSHSQGQLLKGNFQKSRDQKPLSPHFLGRKLPQHTQKAELSEYKKLYDKLDSLQNKLTTMKVSLEKKKAQKETAIQKNQREKKAREQDRQKKLQQQSIAKEPKQQPRERSENILKGIVTQVPKVNKQLHSFDHNPYSPRHNMYYVSEITRAYKEDKSLARQHLLTSMQLLKIMSGVKRMSNEEYTGKVLNLTKKPCYKDKKTVVFDLDETLIHCNQTTDIPHDVALPITFPTGEIIEAGINIRPYAQQILRALAPNFQIIIFTASHSCYANVVLDHLDPDNSLIQHRLYREHCHVTSQGMHVKDLRVINRKETDMVLVDNAAYSYAFQLDNGIPMIPYYEGKNDFQLKALQTYLERLIWVPDVRQVNKKVFKLHEYKDYEDPESLVQELYTEWL